MKINFNSVNLGLSGGNRFIFELSNALVDRGYKVTITHAGLPKYHEWFTPIKAEIIECGYSNIERILMKAKIKKYSQEERLQRLTENIPDCDINVATYCLTAKPTVDSKKGKMFYLVQHYEPTFFKEETVGYKLAEESYTLPLQKLCVSEWLAEKVKGKVIGNGVNLEKFKPSKNKIPFSALLMVRKDIAWKRPELTLKIAKTLKSSVYSVFIADGKLTDEDLAFLYRKCEFFIYLSEQEGYGLPGLEAMASNCVVVSTDCSPYLKDMINCYIVKPSEEDVIAAILKLSRNTTLCELLAANGLKTAKQHDFTKVVDNFEKAIGAKQ